MKGLPKFAYDEIDRSKVKYILQIVCGKLHKIKKKREICKKKRQNVQKRLKIRINIRNVYEFDW